MLDSNFPGKLTDHLVSGNLLSPLFMRHLAIPGSDYLPFVTRTNPVKSVTLG